MDRESILQLTTYLFHFICSLTECWRFSTTFTPQSIPLFFPLTLIEFIIIIIIIIIVVDKYTRRRGKTTKFSFQSNLWEKAFLKGYVTSNARERWRKKPNPKMWKCATTRNWCWNRKPKLCKNCFESDRVSFIHHLYIIYDGIEPSCLLVCSQFEFVSAEILAHFLLGSRLCIKCSAHCRLRTRKQNMSASRWNENPTTKKVLW